MTSDAQHFRELESALRGGLHKFKQDIQAIRGNRPSPELIENITVTLYDQPLSIKQLGSLSVVPPRDIHITVWDKNAVGAISKAIEEAKMGLSVSTQGNVVRASLSPLGDERREELIRLVKKTSEAERIQIRHHRDEAIKKVKVAGEGKEITEDQVFALKEKMQKLVDGINEEVEALLQAKLKELGE